MCVNRSMRIKCKKFGMCILYYRLRDVGDKGCELEVTVRASWQNKICINEQCIYLHFIDTNREACIPCAIHSRHRE